MFLHLNLIRFNLLLPTLMDELLVGCILNKARLAVSLHFKSLSYAKLSCFILSAQIKWF